MPSPHQHCTVLGSPEFPLIARAAVFSTRERRLFLCCLRSLSLSIGSADNRLRRQPSLRHLLLSCIFPLYPAQISHLGKIGKSDPRLFCPDSVTAASAGSGESELALVFGSTMWPSAGRRRGGSSTDPATTDRSTALSRCPSAGQPPPHTFFIAASLATTSSSAARNSASVTASLLLFAVVVRYAVASARAASRCVGIERRIGRRLVEHDGGVGQCDAGQRFIAPIRIDLYGPRHQRVRVAQLPLSRGRLGGCIGRNRGSGWRGRVRASFVRATISAATATTNAIAARATAGHVRARGGGWVLDPAAIVPRVAGYSALHRTPKAAPPPCVLLKDPRFGTVSRNCPYTFHPFVDPTTSIVEQAAGRRQITDAAI